MEEMQDKIREIEIEDLHAFRRLRIGCPVHGHFYGMLKLQHATAPITTDQENSYFYSREQLGGYVGYVGYTTAKPSPR